MEQIKEHRWMAGMDLDGSYTMTGSPEESSDGEWVRAADFSVDRPPQGFVDPVMPPPPLSAVPPSVCAGVGSRPVLPPTGGGLPEVVVYSDKVLRVMQEQGIDIQKTIQVLSYCLANQNYGYPVSTHDYKLNNLIFLILLFLYTTSSSFNIIVSETSFVVITSARENIFL